MNLINAFFDKDFRVKFWKVLIFMINASPACVIWGSSSSKSLCDQPLIYEYFWNVSNFHFLTLHYIHFKWITLNASRFFTFAFKFSLKFTNDLPLLINKGFAEKPSSPPIHDKQPFTSPMSLRFLKKKQINIFSVTYLPWKLYRILHYKHKYHMRTINNMEP